MTRRVEAPDALAEQRGRGKDRAVAPIPHQETQRPKIGSALLGARLTVGRPAYPGGSVGPNPTPRTRLVGPTRLEPCRSRSATPGLGPEVVTTSVKYSRFGPLPQHVGLGPP